MDIQTLLQQHAAGEFNQVFDGNTSTYIVKATSVRDTDTGPVRGRLHQGPCHACVSREMSRPHTIAVVTKSDPNLVDNAGAVKFYDWLLNRSFFSDVFLCKDPKLSLAHGFVKRTDINSSRWLGAAQLSRLATSEYKLQAMAIYDVLASGYEIHPLLLILLATNTGWSTDGKRISARSGFSETVTWCQGYTHLPFVFLRTAEQLKEACVDNPEKPVAERFLNREALQHFRITGWKSNSNQILTVAPQGTNGTLDGLLHSKLYKTFPTTGTGSPLFGAEKEEVGYDYLWPFAVKEIQRLCRTSTQQKGGQAVNLTALVELSKELRQKQTEAEEILWEILRNRKFNNLKFRRQHPIGRYIADFYCEELKIIIELD